MTTSRFPGSFQRLGGKIRLTCRHYAICELLVLCLPALVLAFVLRAYLIWHFPVAFSHDDSASLLETGHHLLEKSAFATEGKKTPLVPALYCIPALISIPVLAFAAAVQHTLGLVSVIVVGLLVRAWFDHWKVFIVPITTLIALHPTLLWYEHVALAETYAVFTALLTPLVGWLYYNRPTLATLALFLLSLLLVATARPEGNLFALFGVALVAWVNWGKGKTFVVATSASCVWAILLFAITQTSQSGTLLFASVVHLTPDRLLFSPGIAEAVSPLREASRAEWTDPGVPGLVGIRKSLQQAVQSELVSRGLSERTARAQSDGVCKLAALETVLRNPLTIPPLVLKKFVVGHHEPPAPGFNEYARQGQLSALFEDGVPQKGLRYAKLAWGREFGSRAEAEAYFAATTSLVPGDWLGGYLRSFQRISLLPILPIKLPGADTPGVDLPGIPWLYALAICGAVALCLRPPHPVNFHVLFGGFLLGLFVVVMLTANVRARFRLTFEPFWFLYAAAFLDYVWMMCRPRSRNLA